MTRVEKTSQHHGRPLCRFIQVTKGDSAIRPISPLFDPPDIQVVVRNKVANPVIECVSTREPVLHYPSHMGGLNKLRVVFRSLWRTELGQKQRLGSEAHAATVLHVEKRSQSAWVVKPVDPSRQTRNQYESASKTSDSAGQVLNSLAGCNESAEK